MFKTSKENSWQGVTVAVTGGSQGIGFATARAFLEAGAQVAICARNVERLQAAERQLRTFGHVLSAVANVRESGQGEDFVDQVEEALGPIDVLVNNAGIAYVGAFVDEPYDSISAVIDINLKGLIYMTRAVLPSMIERHHGVIVNVSSGAGLSGFPNLVSYCASKFGVVGFTESLDQEVRTHGVRVYGVCPGRVATEMQVRYSGEKMGIPPEQVTERIVQLARPGSKARTGTCITIG